METTLVTLTIFLKRFSIYGLCFFTVRDIFPRRDVGLIHLHYRQLDVASPRAGNIVHTSYYRIHAVKFTFIIYVKQYLWHDDIIHLLSYLKHFMVSCKMNQYVGSLTDVLDITFLMSNAYR